MSERQFPPLDPDPVRTYLQSMDLDVRLCVHELASALASFSTKTAVPLYGASVEFDAAAEIILDIIKESAKCQLKGA